MGQHGRHAADHADFAAVAQSRPEPGRPRILVLGGSTEGFAAAEALTAAGYEVISSFAGRTKTRRSAVGEERVGSFGGAKGLGAYLAVENIAAVVDALHPFASKMKANAGIACADTGTPIVHIDRPQWRREPGDDWRIVSDVAAAAAATPATAGVCLLTIGRQHIKAFEKRKDLELLIRVIDPPERPFRHKRATFLAQRGPFALEAERALFAERNVTCLVAKNSGSHAAEAKLIVARERGIPVVIVDRPVAPDSPTVADVDLAVAEVGRMLAEAGAC
ncbi:cobalt-precorrin-6A reductase [Hansschlegelia quercus]|uniref:Cobalt-precorrin-6A reductase n=1 Tax=Hansschlegelia quercus TaxID=2528245 RepID=A0A4Q9GJI9_9HYPH|nr:cobalt-precorrin-6A reductase [Hansschlegelia quercus]TBN54302.1 cobalt-precorrin-6A reductase [Hansschlegelia quercus]